MAASDDRTDPGDERFDAVLREVTTRIVAATSRGEIERAVCERLAETYRFAWVGVPRGSEETLVASEWAGDDEGDLDAVTVTTDGSETGHGPADRAYRTGDPQVTRDIRTDSTFEPWREAAVSRGFRASAAIPIRHRGTVHAVLNLYSTVEGAFGDDAVEALSELGEVAGYAINAVENRRLLHADSVVELEFYSADDGSFFTLASAELDCTLELDGVVPARENAYLFYVSVDEGAGATLREFAAGYESVVDATVLREGDGTSLVLLEVVGTTMVTALIEAGVRVRSATASIGESLVVAQVTPDAEVGPVVDAVVRAFPDAKLVGKREVDRPVQTAWAFRESVKSHLTDRQVAVLEAALRSGYFARPRDVSGSDLAESFDITPSTFHHHLQAGLRKVVGAVFDEDAGI